MNTKKVLLYTYIRVFATILVVIGHCSTLALTNKTGYVNIDLSYVSMSSLFETMRKLIYSFHMPLFVALSGSVFTYKLPSGSIITFIKKKAKRLLVPYIVIGTFLLVPVRILINYYGKLISIKQYFYDIILSMDARYLWYLIMLFQLLIIFYLFVKKFDFKKTRYFILLLILSIAASFLPALPFQINRVLELAFWFYIGMLFEHMRSNNLLIKNLKKIIILLIIFITSLFASKFLDYLINNINLSILYLTILKLVKVIVRYIMQYFIILLIYNLFNMFQKSNHILLIIEKYSMEIYLYHVIFIYLYRWILNKYGILNQLTNMSFTILILIQILIVILASIIFSISCNKIKTKFVISYKS